MAKIGTNTKLVKANIKIPIESLTDYHTKIGSYLFDFSKNLGEGGVFVATQHLEATGHSVELSFTSGDHEKLLIKGDVIWVQFPVDLREDVTTGMGVQLVATPSELDLLKGMVHKA